MLVLRLKGAYNLHAQKNVEHLLRTMSVFSAAVAVIL